MLKYLLKLVHRKAITGSFKVFVKRYVK